MRKFALIALCGLLGTMAGVLYGTTSITVRDTRQIAVLQRQVDTLNRIAVGNIQHQLGLTSSVNITQCAPDVSPCVAWQDETTDKIVQVFEILDHNGAPIFACNNAGGCWVGDDHLGVTGASVYDHAIYMWSPDGVHGALVIDGQTMTGADIGRLHHLLVMLQRSHVTLANLLWLARQR